VRAADRTRDAQRSRRSAFILSDQPLVVIGLATWLRDEFVILGAVSYGEQTLALIELGEQCPASSPPLDPSRQD
jgi:hypothetical protein